MTASPRMALLLVALLLPLVPVALVPMPPLFDYHNHFARLWLLGGSGAGEAASGMYAVDWSGGSTNIGIDLIGTAAAGVILAETLMPLLLGLALVLPATGLVLLHRAVFGGWHPWQVGFAVLAWNTTVLEGFLNFHIGLGLGLIAASTEPRLQHRHPAAALGLRAAIAAVLLLVHPFAAMFYTVLAGALALGADRAAWLQPRRLGRVVLVGIAIALPVLLLVLLAPALPGADQEAAQRTLFTG